MPYYIPDLTPKTTCIGNTLSTFNISFSSLDTNLYNLSTYAVNSINYLSATMVSVSATLATRINYLSSTMVSTSATLNTRINYLSSTMVSTSGNIMNEMEFVSSSVDYVSANVVKDFILQGTLTVNPAAEIDWNFSSVGNNAIIELSSYAKLNNPTEMYAGQSGNLIIKVMSAGAELSAFGSLWTFVDNNSAFYTTVSAKNIISYYYDGEQILTNINFFNI
jgi:hypothetical protein